MGTLELLIDSGVVITYKGLFLNQVKAASDFGAAGIILFSDPINVAPFPSIPVYPDSWWLPPTGIQRGSILLLSGENGDPQTPRFPSTGNLSLILPYHTSQPTLSSQ